MDELSPPRQAAERGIFDAPPPATQPAADGAGQGTKRVPPPPPMPTEPPARRRPRGEAGRDDIAW